MIDNVKMIVTLDDPIFMENGFTYNAVFGRVHIRRAEEILGFQPKGVHTNWYVEITGEKRKEGHGVFIAGCRIAKWVPCEELTFNPASNRVVSLNTENVATDFYYSSIYVVE